MNEQVKVEGPMTCGQELRRSTIRERLQRNRKNLADRLRPVEAALALLDSNESIESIYNVIDAAL